MVRLQKVRSMGENLDKLQEEVLGLMSKGKYIAPVKLLIPTLKSIEKTDIPRFGDFLVDLARMYPDLFIEKIYIAFHFKARKLVSQEILYELDKYIIDNYCLLEGEIPVDLFLGSLRETYNHINNGRIFLTNFRIIACGYPLITGTTSSIGPKSFAQIGMDFAHAKKGETLRKSMNKSINKLDVITYGYYYPIHNARKIKKGKSHISYKVNMKVYITPSKSIKDRARKEEILSNIETLLIQNQ